MHALAHQRRVLMSVIRRNDCSVVKSLSTHTVLVGVFIFDVLSFGYGMLDGYVTRVPSTSMCLPQRYGMTAIMDFPDHARTHS